MIRLHSNGCSRCRILKKKLQDKHITFQECNDENEFARLGFRNMPILEVDGDMLEFTTAILYLNSLGGT